MKLDMKSLDVAIREFNEWSRAARIYLDTSDGIFETSVYANDMQMEAQSSTKNYVCVFYKDEFQQKHVGDKRKKYITKYSELILDGWGGMQADYHLSDMGIFG